MRGSVVGKAMWKSLELLLFEKPVNQKKISYLLRTAEIRATKDLNNLGAIAPTTPTFSFAI